ncbi:hypothetical protein CP979_17700 [Streptomyces filamentosus]|nr:hypothetical protein CP979_17700 [Streptomyces filamentosus]
MRLGADALLDGGRQRALRDGVPGLRPPLGDDACGTLGGGGGGGGRLLGLGDRGLAAGGGGGRQADGGEQGEEDGDEGGPELLDLGGGHGPSLSLIGRSRMVHFGLRALHTFLMICTGCRIRRSDAAAAQFFR